MPVKYRENRENLNGNLLPFALKYDNLPRERRIKNAFNLRLFPISHNIKCIQGLNIKLVRNNPHCMRNMFILLF